jgi:hypothetical protein
MQPLAAPYTLFYWVLVLPLLPCRLFSSLVRSRFPPLPFSVLFFSVREKYLDYNFASVSLPFHSVFSSMYCFVGVSLCPSFLPFSVFLPPSLPTPVPLNHPVQKQQYNNTFGRTFSPFQRVQYFPVPFCRTHLFLGCLRCVRSHTFHAFISVSSAS